MIRRDCWTCRHIEPHDIGGRLSTLCRSENPGVDVWEEVRCLGCDKRWGSP